MTRAILLASLALAACTPMPAPPTSGVMVQADVVVLTGERAFAAAELAYITAAKGVGLLVDQGVIRGELAQRVRGYNTTARAVLVTGKATADAAEKARAAAALFQIADRLNTIIGSR